MYNVQIYTSVQIYSHTQTHTYLWIYIYVCVCVCVCVKKKVKTEEIYKFHDLFIVPTRFKLRDFVKIQKYFIKIIFAFR